MRAEYHLSDLVSAVKDNWHMVAFWFGGLIGALAWAGRKVIGSQISEAVYLSEARITDKLDKYIERADRERRQNAVDNSKEHQFIISLMAKKE